MLFSFEDNFFAYKYLSAAGEQRLVNNNYQLGIGGHINKDDLNGSEDILEAGAEREWEEEVHFKGKFLEKKLVGIIKDETTSVEKVHIGLVYHFVGDSPNIFVEETDKMEGKLIPVPELASSVSHSPWMNIVFEQYINKPNPNQKKLFKEGKFFVFEGIDGCGKSTQTKLLADYYRSLGFQVEKIDFPQHGQRSSAMVDDYLTGKYGSLQEVGPYVASIFYAIDRYDASIKIKKWLSEGRIVISDRYLVSNIGHQGGKLIHNKEEWKKYVDWLYNLEYGIFKIPKPDCTFILKTSAEFSLKLANNITDKEKQEKRKAYLGDSAAQDIHEKDKKHLENALESYLLAAEEFPEDFKVIECLEMQMLSPDDIGQKIINKINL
jgi:dTMP kinase